uniref:Kinesin motor domain-containing protein n=2 Tax=Aegilops tauschii subsp. strangulata TaxID=200361 RepID=A0A453S1P4_AEGTS
PSVYISIMNSSDALERLSEGIANRAVGETQMNLASSRSHCVYIFSVQHGSTADDKVRAGKIVLVDLAGSEKVEKTGAEGRVLDEAKTINKSLSALGNVINALTTAKPNHVPYRDSKLTRILQDALVCQKILQYFQICRFVYMAVACRVAAQELHCYAAVLLVRRTHQKVCLPFALEPGRSS